MAEYEVVVGNIGTVYRGPDYGIALDNFDEYYGQSRFRYGRASMEQVTLLCDGEPMKDYTPPPPLDPDLARELVAAVKAHAEAHYNESGWDYIVECFTDEEIEQNLRQWGVKTVEQAITEFGDTARLYAERRSEVEAERF